MELIKDKICIVIPIYNKAASLEASLTSVLNSVSCCRHQVEALLIDDASTDGSAGIAKNFENKYPNVFTYFRIQHKGKYGPVNARNVGIRLADGEYIAFLDADDEFIPEHINRCLDFLQKHSDFDIYGESFIRRDTNDVGDLVETNAHFDNQNIYNIKQIYKESQSFPNFSSCVYRTELVKVNPFIDCVCEDQVFMLNLMHRCRKFWIDTNEIGFIYNQQYCDVSAKSNDTHHVQQEYKDNYVVMYMNVLTELNPDYPMYLKWHKEGDLDYWEMCERE